jgi:hypothetical protein
VPQRSRQLVLADRLGPVAAVDGGAAPAQRPVRLVDLDESLQLGDGVWVVGDQDVDTRLLPVPPP